jgi:hypothetical protein
VDVSEERKKFLVNYDGKIEKNEMGGGCDSYGVGVRCAQGSGGEA